MVKKDYLNECIKIVWIFVIGSLFGYLLEIIVALLQYGHFVNRQGVLYGPFIPIYGIGAVLLLILNKKVNKLIYVFFLGMILGGFVEYISSFMQEILFNTASWNYTKLPYNISGRTSLLHMSYWGTLSVVFAIIINPITNKINPYLEKKEFKYFTILLIVFMIINIEISCIAAYRQRERLENIEANGIIDALMDKYYPNEVLDKTFTNKKKIID